ncbi:ribokinase [Catenulispora pinisilvae]|uniref:ribokinase n=1 Tax=Catenulispora pinisilvae TaxID=2705253 RepID=UPI001891AC50|nr:ribokinase [Catenulispora pinisilvae]
MASVTVVGSVNRDVVLQVRGLPRPGETVHAVGSREGMGGKGANQAVAAARLGSTVRLVAKVGGDARDILASLAGDGVDTGWIATAERTRTGLALITVDEPGENTIVLDGGANRELTVADLPEVLTTAGDVLMTQGEIPPEVTGAAITRAAAQGATVILNPAPAYAFDDDVLKRVDVLVPNLGELCTLLGVPVPATSGEVGRLLARHPLPVSALVVTLGADGAIVHDQDGTVHIPAPRVAAVDTVGAGDTFCGALADSLVRGRPLRAAAERAVLAAALSVTGVGAQSAMPTAEEVDLFAQQQEKTR